MAPLYRQAAWAVTAPLGLWCTFLALSTIPSFQRNFLYAHRVWPFWQDSNQPEKWGFAKNQVTPFNISTDDGETLHAWHILPLRTYSQHEATLVAQPGGLCPDISTAESFRILKNDPSAKLIIHLHGNAGHIPNAIRAPSFHTLTDTTNYHILTIDYRGFGRSTGTPTEAGLIADASALLDFALSTAGVAPSQIVILGQSLGTAVATALVERYSGGTAAAAAAAAGAGRSGVDFAGVVLVASFSSLPTMLSGYAIAGWVPVLRPLRVWPRLLRWITGFVVDKWDSAARLRGLVAAVKARGGHLRLGLVHARDDWDIPCEEDDVMFRAAVGGLLDQNGGDGAGVDERAFAEMKDQRTVGRGKDAFVAEWRDGNVLVRQELFPHGGHNDIMLSAPVILEVMRSFGDIEDGASPV